MDVKWGVSPYRHFHRKHDNESGICFRMFQVPNPYVQCSKHFKTPSCLNPGCFFERDSLQMIISIYRVNNPQLVIHHHLSTPLNMVKSNPYKYLINLYLVDGIPTPLKNMFVRQLG